MAEARGGELPFSEEAVMADFLRDHVDWTRDLVVDARKVEEGALRRHEAAAWLREVVGEFAAKDLPAEPCEAEFRAGLRSGIILCKALNVVQNGAVHKVYHSI
ncbi:hypothetical protein M569_16647 [Genlisea aurea]|uniref:Calponin-homology (CH) domain-containing protein n=1 Tax=Genlisea aurea TaxID=192259 RepID=S8BUW7_9LAMI|nr:hypothetical protein M569_16647 [Genlisea aurea]